MFSIPEKSWATTGTRLTVICGRVREKHLLPFVPRLAFAARDESFVANLEQCNGCGGCTKQTPTMCPTYLATGEEGMSTRGRANLIRAVLDNSTGCDPLQAEELEFALENCLACRACTNECPFQRQH